VLCWSASSVGVQACLCSHCTCGGKLAGCWLIGDPVVVKQEYLR
jgi:hypothetical protein